MKAVRIVFYFFVKSYSRKLADNFLIWELQLGENTRVFLIKWFHRKPHLFSIFLVRIFMYALRSIKNKIAFDSCAHYIDLDEAIKWLSLSFLFLFSYYGKQWVESQGGILDLLEVELPSEPAKPEKVPRFSYLSDIFLLYHKSNYFFEVNCRWCVL